MKLTLFVDASLCLKTGAAGYGAWTIRDDWARGQYTGGPIELTARIKDSNTAELAGIAIALWQHQHNRTLEGVDSVMIQCDNVNALGQVLGCVRIPPAPVIIKTPNAFIKKLPSAGIAHAMTQTIASILEGRRVFLKHVKGHTANEDGRSWVNRHCDTEARKHMQAQKSKIQLQTIIEHETLQL